MRGGITENSPKERSGAEREVRRQMEDGLGEALLKESRQRQDRLLQRKGISRENTDAIASGGKLVPVEASGREAEAKRSGNTGERLSSHMRRQLFYFTGNCFPMK